MVENMLRDICSAHDFSATCLRYFNAAGAHESCKIGEAHDPETHLIPNVIKAALSNKSNLKVFGNDYPTSDGTCVRDYVHVTDLAQAHLLGLKHMQKNKGFSAFNLGNGDGFSILEVINGCQHVTGTEISFKICDRREGDPAQLVADNRLALSSLDWCPKYNNIYEIIKTAWLWHKSKKC
jgi:UDP-glucose 4-epimerase